MFKKVMTAIAVGLVLVSGSALAEPSPAPTRVETPTPAVAQNADTAFIAWVQQVMAILERANSASAPFLQMNLDAETPETARAMLRSLAQQAGTARAELARARAELDAMRPFSHPAASADMLSISEVLLRDSRSSVANLNQLLGHLIAFIGAIERGDRAEINRLLPELDRGSVLLMRSQATTLRARQQLVEATTSTYHAVGGMASMYDGMAAFGGAEPDLAALESAIAGLRSSIIAQRAALSMERAMLADAHPNRAAIAELLQTREQFADTSDRALSALAQVAQDIRSGAYNEDLALEYLRTLGLIELEYQRLARRQIEIYALLSQ